jgi:hypothetical protein
MEISVEEACAFFKQKNLNPHCLASLQKKKKGGAVARYEEGEQSGLYRLKKDSRGVVYAASVLPLPDK